MVPARMRRKFGIDEGSLVIAEERDDGILIRPAVAVPVEIYTPARVAEFLLSNAVTPVSLYADEEIERLVEADRLSPRERAALRRRWGLKAGARRRGRG